ncbi:MAG: TIGR03905 family TSCPD domain-containing protein [Muribaculaceae bacterium]|nr:TIGR03905 family TSCPD domain-containing protein [Muribaculaceae bacterium]
MRYSFRTQGTCSRVIELDIENGVVSNVVFYGGCDGNLKGISQLVEGMQVSEVISRLKGIRCGTKPTSCPDQLATALEQVVSIK